LLIWASVAGRSKIPHGARRSDREAVAEALNDAKEGRVGGPFNSVEELISSLHGARRPRKAKAAKRSA
jgi:hypothetical protein